jgi:hypothetical protein
MALYSLAGLVVGVFLGSGGKEKGNTINSIQEVENNFLNVTTNVCSTTITNEIENDAAYIDCSGQNCNISVFTIESKNNATCAINQQINQSAENMLLDSSSITEELYAGLFGIKFPWSQDRNAINVQQSVFNNMTNILNNTCNSSVTNTIKNNNVIIRAGGTNNNIRAYNINSDNSAVCGITNVVNQEAFNKLQSNKDIAVKETSMLQSLATVLIVCAVIIFIILFFLFGGGNIFNFLKPKKDEKKEEGEKVEIEDVEVKEEDEEDEEEGGEEEDKVAESTSLFSASPKSYGSTGSSNSVSSYLSSSSQLPSNEHSINNGPKSSDLNPLLS